MSRAQLLISPGGSDLLPAEFRQPSMAEAHNLTTP